LAQAFVLGMLGFPLGGVALLLLYGDRRLSAHEVNRVALAASALVVICALGLVSFMLLPTTPSSLEVLELEWLPGTGSMHLHVDARTLLILVAVSLGLTLVLSAERTAEKGVVEDDGLWRPVLLKSLALLALTATQVAVLSSSFLSRYLALEIVGLCIGLAPLIVSQDGFRRAARVYLVLRVGDAGLLIAILMLMQLTGVLDISSSLAAALMLALSQRVWIAGAFVLAVWVKVGAWPMHIWLRDAEELPFVSRVWLYGTSMPMLGLYLLYRVAPLLQTVDPLRNVVLVAAGLATLAALILTFVHRRRPQALMTYVWSATGGAALCLGALGAQQIVWVWVLAMPLFVAVSGRDVSGVLSLATAPTQGATTDVMSESEEAAEGFFGTATRWLYRVVELEGVNDLVAALLGALGSLARLVQRFEHAALDAMVSVTVGVLGFMTRLTQRVEHGALDGLIGASVGGTRLVARRVQRLHTGRLRLNLLWVVIGFLIALFVLLGGS
jgi:hypothetical protein